MKTEELKTELKELTDKYNKLSAFIDSKEFNDLDEYIKDQMADQHYSMLNYKWSLINMIDYMEEMKELLNEHI